VTSVGFRRRLGFSLRDRLLALNLGTVLILVLLSLVVINTFARRQIRRDVAQDLVQTGTVFTRFMQVRAQWLRTQSLVVAEDPRFSAALDVPDVDLEAHARTVGSEAKRFQGVLGSDLFIVTNRSGTVLSRLELQRPTHIDSRLERGPGQLWHVDGMALHVVEVAVQTSDEVHGSLVVGFISPFDPQPVSQLLTKMAAETSVLERLQDGSIQDLLWDLQVTFVPGVAAILGPDGSVLDMLLCRASHGEQLGEERAIAEALAGRQHIGLRTEGGRLFQTVSVPVWSPDGLLGSLLTGFEIDDQLALGVEDMTHSEVSFFTDAGRLVASTLQGQDRAALTASPASDTPFESDVGDETFLSLAGSFGIGEGVGGTFLIQRSLDEAYDFLYTLEELLLLVALVVIPLATAASFIGARRLTQPVEALVDGTRALGAGNLDHRIDITSRSELGELASSFNVMAQDLQQSRQTLVESEKLRALGEMAAGVAHNFNNLLTVVVGNAELINLHDDIPEGIRQETRGILESARRCSAIVRRIQTFGRPIDLEVREQVDLAELSRDVIELTRPKWKTEPERDGRRIRVDTNLVAVPAILTQGSAWEEILSNLIFNAVDAMPDGGLITLSTEVVGSELMVEVRDTGTGMDTATRQRIFDPFYTTKGKQAGTGLGLSTVWSLVQHLGGRVEVDTELGQGTAFQLFAPLDVAVEQASTEHVAVSAPSAGLDILVVDDEPQVLELVPPLLEGHHIVIARGGSLGLEIAANQAFDVVLSDWVMDEASGLEIAAAARQQHAAAVIVLMTGWAFDAEQVEGGHLVDLVLAKPFERDTVIERVQAACQLVESRRSAATGTD
jgi:signal transduction histidine kinase/ActR/RegA family two-component response regulator